jgi:hypothetical protein
MDNLMHARAPLITAELSLALITRALLLSRA